MVLQFMAGPYHLLLVDLAAVQVLLLPSAQLVVLRHKHGGGVQAPLLFSRQPPPAAPRGD